jgi:hypothetical protein
MLEFYGKHWMLPSNVDWCEGIVLKTNWSVCEGDQTKFEPNAFCMYFGSQCCQNRRDVLILRQTSHWCSS